MTKEEIRQALLSGKHIHYHVWSYWKAGYTCSEGCCLTEGESIEDVMQAIGQHCDQKWGECFIE